METRVTSQRASLRSCNASRKRHNRRPPRPNAGPARVRQLRDQAAAEGYDPYIWVENVEIIAARNIGRETVRYVRNVLKYYVAYRMAWENAERSQALPMNM